ncbi:hypothetical protein SAMN02745218_02084 [Desulfofundulus australicus DSM 11792]|uniref:Uncharacterized protein n=1 Tax=Desulfofundulus australicus DSM 11792 TaxID=1121425 RepID=A0A1M5B3M6_9FIRM|nr:MULTISPECIES: DsrE family protein [Desulfofundulus]SHF37069.1 hypothetical protein SAMN02745218_02084 [Desulfofundulus australicus DSM 11792]
MSGKGLPNDAGESSKMKVLFHINEAERWPRVITNIINFLRDVGAERASIVVLANGSGVLGYNPGEQDLISQMENLHKVGVAFIACRNALIAHEINEEGLPDFVVVVPAGITEIVRRQVQGYAYIKP